MYRIRVPLFGVLIIMLLLLTACGSAPASPTSPTGFAPSEVVATPDTSEAPTTSKTPVATEVAASTPFTFGMVLVGPINDGGWSQAHYEGAKYTEAKLPGSRFIYVDKVNPADRPNIKVEQVVDDLVSQGAQLIITNSDDFKDGTREAAKAHPGVHFLHISGDDVLRGQAPPNLRNLMGRMEYGKMIAGCAAALQSESGKIAYLGPLINDETRRLVNSAYLGAKHCWGNFKGDQAAKPLEFSVTWIGFWFNIPGFTLDPTKVANDFINSGNDVIIAGIDTTEGLIEANKASAAGKKVFAVPYDFRNACAQAEAVCLGVPYFNWGPDYVRLIERARAGKWESAWEWQAPDWTDINNADTSPVGFVKGPALSAEHGAQLDTFIKGLADGSIVLFKGPLKFQDGSTYLADGKVADDKQIWYTSQLLEGIKGSEK